MRFDSCFAGYNAYRYIPLYIAIVVFFADTGMGRLARRPKGVREIRQGECILSFELSSYFYRSIKM